MFQPIDIYFERQGPGFWAEPVNAWTNLAFIVAAAVLWSRVRPDPAQRLLIVLIAVIGMASFAFHTFANRLTMLADVLSIAAFVYIYLGVFIRRVGRLGPLATAATLGGFIAFQAAFMAVLGPVLGALASYLPVLLAMIGAAAGAAARRSPAARPLALAAAVFIVSLTARTIDGHDHLAAHAPGGVGTHWLWHLLNAVVLALAVAAIDAHERTTPPTTGNTREPGP